MAAGLFEISKFMGNMTKGGALSSLFSVRITGLPSKLLTNKSLSTGAHFAIKTASFPASTIATTEVSYMGRTVTIPANREAQQITTEFYNDEDHGLRADLLKWMDGINGHTTNQRKKTATQFADYRGTMEIVQHMKDHPDADKNPNVVTVHSCWPSEVAEVTLDWESNEVQTFEVTWEMSHWTQTAGKVGAQPT